MHGRPKSIVLFILAIIHVNNPSMLAHGEQFTINVEKNSMFRTSCLVGTFNITHGKISECLEHCLINCRCQSFQVCQNTKCQLCSSNKEDDSALLRKNGSCIYAMYKIPHSSATFQKIDDHCSGLSCSLKYNCCQHQTGLCPKNKICNPINSIEQPWKRFACKCPDGYHGKKCNKPSTSSKGSRKRLSLEQGTRNGE